MVTCGLWSLRSGRAAIRSVVAFLQQHNVSYNFGQCDLFSRCFVVLRMSFRRCGKIIRQLSVLLSRQVVEHLFVELNFFSVAIVLLGNDLSVNIRLGRSLKLCFYYIQYRGVK